MGKKRNCMPEMVGFFGGDHGSHRGIEKLEGIAMACKKVLLYVLPVHLAHMQWIMVPGEQYYYVF